MKSQRPDTGRGGSRGNWGEQRQQPRNMKPGNPEKRKVYVAGIGPDAKEDDIRRVFENYTVEHVYMRFEGEKKAHCFVVFSTEAEAQEVLQESFTLNNRPITVKAPTPKPDAGTANSSGSFRDQGPKEQSADKEKELFVANLPNNIEEGNLMTLFESYGVEKVVLKKPENRKPFAFLTLRDKAAVAAAVNEMNNHLFWGKKLSVALSGQKAEGPKKKKGPPGTSGQPYRGSQNGSATPSESGAPDESWDKPLGPPVLSQPTGIVDSPPSDDPPPLSRVVADHGQGDGPPALVRPAGDGPPALVRPAGDGPPAGGRASAASFNGPAPLYRMTNGAPLLDSPPALARISGQEPQGTTAHKQVHEVFVGNLRADTTEDEIRDIFAKYGVISIFMKGRPLKPVAFVGLESAASVESAIRDLDGNSVGTQTNLAVRKADGPKPKGKLPKAVASTVPSTGRDPFSNENKLFVANLPKQVTKDDVLQLFGKYGVRETFLISTKGTPYAFVTLTTEAGFNRAFEEMQGFMFRGCKLFMGLPASRDGDHGAHPGPKAAAPTTAAAAPAPASKLSSPVTLCVANFPPETKMTDIAELFSSWDPLEVVMGRTDPTGQHSYTHAYVTMPTWDEAEDAVFTLSETYFRERIITVAVLPEKCKRPY